MKFDKASLQKLAGTLALPFALAASAEAAEISLAIADDAYGQYSYEMAFDRMNLWSGWQMIASGDTSVVYMELNLGELRTELESVPAGESILSAKLQVYAVNDAWTCTGLGAYSVDTSASLTGNVSNDLRSGYFPKAASGAATAPRPDETALLDSTGREEGDSLLMELNITNYILELLADGNVSYAGIILACPDGNAPLYGTSGNGSQYLECEPMFVVTTGAIPEPSAFGLLAGTLALALVASRRRKKA